MSSGKSPKKLNKKIIFGLILILIALVCFIGAIFYLYQQPEVATENLAQAPAENQLKDESVFIERKVEQPKVPPKTNPPTTLKVEPEKIEVKEPIKPIETKPEPSPGIDMEKLVDEAKKIYSDEEKNRKDGLLWVDRKTGKYIITLGAIHNLEVGDQLRVYDGDIEIGQVKIEMAMDTISYVKPVNSALIFTENNYYKVVIKN